MEEDRFRNISSGSIAILGSGETSPNLLGVHRTMIDRLENIKNPLLLDSPFGFQENVNQLSTKLKEFFMKSLSLDIDMVSYRTTNEMGSVEYFKCLERISKSNFLFAGPGSPSYAIKVWRDTEFPEHFISLLKNDGSLVFSSAAATTLGEYTLPVYEIYKVGEGRPNVVDEIKNNNIQLIINTPLGKQSRYDEYEIGRAAIKYKVTAITTIEGAQAVVRAVRNIKFGKLNYQSLQDIFKN